MTDSAPDGRGAGPRLAPRPLWRPPVEPGATATFGRPAAVGGSFDRRSSNGSASAELLVAPPVAAELAEAFGRPADARESLQRDPEPPTAAPDDAEPQNPWRDRASVAALSGPAIEVAEPVLVEPAPPMRFGLREAIFDHRLRWRGVVLLLVAALLIGAGGAALGSLLVSRIPVSAADPAFRASGLQPGDVVTAVNGAAVVQGTQLHRVLAQPSPTGITTLTITRAGQTVTVNVPGPSQ